MSVHHVVDIVELWLLRIPISIYIIFHFNLIFSLLFFCKKLLFLLWCLGHRDLFYDEVERAQMNEDSVHIHMSKFAHVKKFKYTNYSVRSSNHGIFVLQVIIKNFKRYQYNSR